MTALCIRYAKEEGISADEKDTLFYAALLRSVACTAFAHEEAHYFGGNDIEVRQTFMTVDAEKSADIVRRAVVKLGRGGGFLNRTKAISNVFIRGKTIHKNMAAAHCEVAAHFVQRLGMNRAVAETLSCNFERWDGLGSPLGLKGNAIPLPSRILNLAYFTVVSRLSLDMESVKNLAAERAGGIFDPEIVHAFAARVDALLAEIDDKSAWEIVKNFNPARAPKLSRTQLCEVLADFADLKSAFNAGHSRKVATLAEKLGRAFQLPATELVRLKDAALAHDVGNVSVPTGIFEKPGCLSVPEREQMALHAWQTARILEKSNALSEIADLAASHHERNDGGGYPQRRRHTQRTLSEQILSVADVFTALTEARAYRPALSSVAALTVLHDEVKAGRLDANVVQKLKSFEASGRVSKRSSWPMALSDREVQVLALAVKGHTNKEIGKELGISARTAGHHVIHIYDKTGLSTRAGLVLFATEHSLV